MGKEYGGIIFSDHAWQRLQKRKISPAEICSILHSPERVLQTKKAGIKKFFRRYGEKTIFAVAKTGNDHKWVILTCWERMKGESKDYFRGKMARKSLLEKAMEKLVLWIEKRTKELWLKK